MACRPPKILYLVIQWLARELTPYIERAPGESEGKIYRPLE
jgi:hypothetical protein